MGRLRIALVVTFMLTTGNNLGVADCRVVNGSFESFGLLDSISLAQLEAWDVAVPEPAFSGRIETSWPTEGGHNLMLAANWFMTFVSGDLATVSQEMLLDDVEKIVFDLKLATLNGSAWDPGVCTAVVLIDNDMVWQPDLARADIRGDYRDQALTVDGKYRDGQLHRLTLGLRMNTDGTFWETYRSYWDALECVARTCSVEPLPSDFNRDCFVNVDDLMLMAGQWLTEVPLDSPYNLCTTVAESAQGTATINGFDFAVLGNAWLAGGVLPAP